MGSPHTIHEWRERDEDGTIRYSRAWRSNGRWHFLTTRKDEPDWHPVGEPDASFLHSLRATLFAKYQRRRVPWEQVAEIDALLADRGESDAR